MSDNHFYGQPEGGMSNTPPGEGPKVEDIKAPAAPAEAEVPTAPEADEEVKAPAGEGDSEEKDDEEDDE